MLDFADVVVINKFERRGAEDALRDVRRQLARNREQFHIDPAELPVFGTVAARFNDDGVTALYQHLRGVLAGHGLVVHDGTLAPGPSKTSTGIGVIVPPARQRYLAEIAEAVRTTTSGPPRRRASPSPPAAVGDRRAARRSGQATPTTSSRSSGVAAERARAGESVKLLEAWPAQKSAVSGARPARSGRRCRARSCRSSRVPHFDDHGELVRWLRSENLPGHFPFTAGVFPFKREGEDPARMFAGEGGPARTNRRFQLLVRGPAGDPAVDRVRLGHAVRLRPGRAPRHLRQGRQLRRLDRHARRHEGALRRVRPVRPDDIGVDDDQRAGADDPRDVPEHRHRPAARSRSRGAKAGRRPTTRRPTSGRGRCAPSGARCRPTSSRRTRARTPASSRPSSRSA